MTTRPEYHARLSTLSWGVVLLLAITFLVHLPMDSAPVPAEDGQRLATSFLSQEVAKSASYRGAVRLPDHVAIQKSTELRDPATGDLLAYVFELDPQGFVVVPAETRLVPVVAYSYEGRFPWEASEENILLTMLRFDLRSRIEATTQGLVPSELPGRNEGLWKAYLGTGGDSAIEVSPTVYGPLLKTEWHQWAPYNNNCTWDSVDEARSPVGCTALALAQILNYWRYPTEVTFTADNSYTTVSTNPNHRFSIDAPAASFTGLDYGTGEPSDADKARLCYAAGVSVRMNYCSKGSGAWVEDVAGALAGSARLLPGVGVLERWGYESADVRSYNLSRSGWGSPYYVTEPEFFSQLADNVVAARPAEMCVSSVHAIVVDGWQSGTRVYHLNYGWGGDSSGWYSLPEGMPAYTVIDCAVLNIRPLAQGNVYAFGDNSIGELGLGDTTIRLSPTEITALSAAARVATAGQAWHSLVLLQNGDVYAWGWNRRGQLGLGDTIDRWTPTRIATLPGPAIAAGAVSSQSLLVLENGEVYACGWNGNGQLGLGDTIDRWTPTRIATLPGPAIAVAGGVAHSLILLQNGDVYACGRNDYGELGLGDTIERWTPTKITALPGAGTAIAAGDRHSLVVLENGEVYAFGWNDDGWLGLGDTIERWTPTRIPALPGVAVAVAGGSYHSLVLLANGEVYAFGQNVVGQLGLGDTIERWTPTKITTLPGPAAAVAAGYIHSLVLLHDGEAYAFGQNSRGQLGLGDRNDRWAPSKITALLEPATGVAAGLFFSYVILGTPPAPPLLSPPSVVAGDGTNSDRVQVSWSDVTGATAYVAHRAASPNETFVQIAEVADTSYDDTGVAPGQIYWYKVAACNDSGCSDLSAADSGYASTASSNTPAAFRVTSSGDVRADGRYYGDNLFVGSADVAEWVPVGDAVEAGAVLELDTAHPGWYRPSRMPCSTLVAGVVSSQPGIVLGGTEPAEGKALLALSGIVPVKVTDEGGPIKPGDLLVTSSTPGHAMRWAGPEPCPCGLVGKALEPMTDHRGLISVLLTAH